MLVAPIITTLSLTPSWFYPHYCSLQQRRPLPLVSERDEDPEEDEEEERGSDHQLSSGEEDNHGEEETFSSIEGTDAQPTRRTSHSKSAGGSRGKRKKKSSRQDYSASDDSDQEANRRPLASSIHHNRQQHRRSSHPVQSKMGGGRKGKASSRASSSKSVGTRSAAIDEANQKRESVEKENSDLKAQLAAMQQRLKLSRTGKGKKSNANQKAMAREVAKCTKQHLWKVCKFIKSDNKLIKATKYVMKQLDLAEMEGLDPKELAEAEEVWIATYKDDVRQALNKQRNYCQQELRSVMEQVFKAGKEAEYPNLGEIEALALRDHLDEATEEADRKEFQLKFDNMWNVLIPKVAGHHAWGPNKRFYGLLSFSCEAVEEGEEVRPYVSPSDEAFLVTMWKNCYEKWWYKEECRRSNVDVDPTNKGMETPYADPKGGQKRFGGWLKEGFDYYEDVRKRIAQNRVKEKECVEQVEQLALERIRKANNVDPEADKKKKATKRKADELEDDDETDDENDFTSWD